MSAKSSYDKRVVYKWPLPSNGNTIQTIHMTKGSCILTVQTQRGQAVIWASAAVRESETEPRRFAIRGTGVVYDTEHMSDRYVGTYQEGPFVWHVFELLG